MKKVSVVIPVYQAEKYIRACIGSLLEQTLYEIEILCVLDCPKDHTGEIVKELAERDERILVVENEKNMGAACSRNKGMKYVTAPYVIFLDADDVFEPDMLETLYHRMEETKADICMFEFNTFMDGKEWPVFKKEQESKYTDVFCIVDLPEEGLEHFGAATWNRIYRKSFLFRNELEFQDLGTGNDVYIGIMSLLLAEKITHTKTDKVYLHYRLGISGQITERANPFDSCMAYQRIHDELKVRGLWEQYKVYFWIKFLMSITRELTNGRNEEYNQQAYQWIQEKGISALELANVTEEDFECPCYAEELKKFLRKEFGTKWFCYAINLQMELDYYRKHILNFCKVWEEQHKKLAVWGAGQYGRTILNFFNENRVHCDMVIDIDNNKIGQYIEGYRICALEEISGQLDIILVANKKYLEEVHKTVSDKGEKIEIITVMDLTGRSNI